MYILGLTFTLVMRLIGNMVVFHDKFTVKFKTVVTVDTEIKTSKTLYHMCIDKKKKHRNWIT